MPQENETDSFHRLLSESIQMTSLRDVLQQLFDQLKLLDSDGTYELQSTNQVFKSRTETFINTNLTSASDKLLTADDLYKQYEEQLKTARVNAQSVIAKSEKEAKDAVAVEIGQARTDAARLIDQTNKELEAQKSLAIQKLETQVDEISQLIKEKLLGKEVVL